VKRLALVAAALLALGPAPAQAVTKEYSTGDINAGISDRLDQSLDVPDAGPVSFLRVSFRITAPNTAKLAIFLINPRGTEVPLVVNRGAGANFGRADRDCGGLPTDLDSDLTTNPISAASAPFTDGPYRAEGNLRSLYGEGAHGRWTLRIENSGSTATLHCLTLNISRAVSQRLSARKGMTQATVSFVENDNVYEKLRLQVVRNGRTRVDSPVQRLGCRECNTFRPVSVKIRDLDGGEPEVLLELYTGGAHCCTVLFVLRYDPRVNAYREKLLFFGNFGYGLIDLDHDGLPEFRASDERFLYTFAAFAYSTAPPQISRYRQGRVTDVTRSFPREIKKDAALLAEQFLKVVPGKDVDVRSVVAAYVADQYLLNRPDQANRALDFALAHGELSGGDTRLGWPSGRNFIAVLMKDLRRWGYIRV
jgi:subtilisin-like proprotein convertase family protein